MIGCGGDGGAGTGPVTAEQAQDLCETTCAHSQDCGTLSGTVDECVSSCASDFGSAYRGDVIQDYADCVADQACTADEEDCLSCMPTSAHEKFETSCRAKVVECGGDTSQADLICETTYSNNSSGDVGTSCFYTPAVMDAFRACFEMDCMAVGDCLNDVETEFGIDG
jgi:hypothetical protein